MAYFGHAAAVVVPALRTPARTAADVLRAFDRLVSRDAARVADAGIEPRVALGLLADVAPTRTHLEVYDRIATEADAGRLAAIGPIVFSNLAVAEPQVEVAAATGLPLLVRTSRAGRSGVESALEHASSLGVSPASIVFDGCGYMEARAVLDGGAWASLDLSPDGLGNGAVDLVCRYGKLLFERAMFSAGGGTSVDVLAFARAAERLSEAGQRGAGVLFANPLRVFGAEGGIAPST